MSIQVLYEIAGLDEHPWAADRAAMIIAMEEQRHSGAITEDEYQELLRDMVRMDTLDAEATDIELKTLLVTAIYAVTKVV